MYTDCPLKKPLSHEKPNKAPEVDNDKVNHTCSGAFMAKGLALALAVASVPNVVEERYHGAYTTQLELFKQQLRTLNVQLAQ